MNTVTRCTLALALAAGIAHANPAADAALAEGRKLYDLQEWDKAIAKFKEAYTLREDAPALFNIAQSYRLKGDCATAAGFYKTFKRKFPKERNIKQVEKFITEMEACAKTAPVKTDPVVAEPVKTEPVKTEPVKTEPVKTEPVATEPVATEPVATEPVTTAPIGAPTGPTPVDTGSSGGGGLRIASYAMFGAGAVGIVIGSVFGVKARAAATEAEELADGEMWIPGIEERGQRHQRIAIAGLVGGGVLVAGGVVAFLLSRPAATETNAVSIMPTGDGASVVWAGRF